MTSMNQANGTEIRASMPMTAAWVERARGKLGAQYVNAILRRAMAGERGLFYAVEAGRFLGTPFDWEPKGAMLMTMSVLTGEPFIAALREPDAIVIGKAGSANGSD